MDMVHASCSQTHHGEQLSKSQARMGQHRPLLEVSAPRSPEANPATSTNLWWCLSIKLPFRGRTTAWLERIMDLIWAFGQILQLWFKWEICHFMLSKFNLCKWTGHLTAGYLQVRHCVVLRAWAMKVSFFMQLQISHADPFIYMASGIFTVLETTTWLTLQRAALRKRSTSETNSRVRWDPTLQTEKLCVCKCMGKSRKHDPRGREVTYPQRTLSKAPLEICNDCFCPEDRQPPVQQDDIHSICHRFLPSPCQNSHVQPCVSMIQCANNAHRLCAWAWDDGSFSGCSSSCFQRSPWRLQIHLWSRVHAHSEANTR